MKTSLFVPATLAALAFSPCVHAASHGHTESQDHAIVKPADLHWRPGPPSLPPGPQMTVLEGDPAREGPFTARFKLPANYRIPPHTHPKIERVTVIEGEFRIGMGREFDESALQALPAGGFFVMPPGMEHFAATAKETIIQLNGIGPWQINYINPEDDPRGR